MLLVAAVQAQPMHATKLCFRAPCAVEEGSHIRLCNTLAANTYYSLDSFSYTEAPCFFDAVDKNNDNDHIIRY